MYILSATRSFFYLFEFIFWIDLKYILKFRIKLRFFEMANLFEQVENNDIILI